MQEVDNKATCECCGEETDISFERTQFLRWLVENNHMFQGQYFQVIEKLDLPDPERMERGKRKQLIKKIFIINDELQSLEDEEAIERLEMRKEKIFDQLKNNFSPRLGTKDGEFDINSLDSQ